MQTRLSLSRKSMTPAKKRLPNYIECEFWLRPCARKQPSFVGNDMREALNSK